MNVNCEESSSSSLSSFPTARIKESLNSVIVFRRWLNRHAESPLEDDLFERLLRSNISTPSVFCELMKRANNEKVSDMGFVAGERSKLFRLSERSLKNENDNREIPDYVVGEDMSNAIEFSMTLRILQQAASAFNVVRRIPMTTNLEEGHDNEFLIGESCAICCDQKSNKLDRLLLKKVRILSNPAIFHHHEQLTPEDFDSSSNCLHLCSWCSKQFMQFKIALIPSFFNKVKAHVLTSLTLPVNVYKNDEKAEVVSPCPLPTRTSSFCRLGPVTTILDKRGQFHSPIPSGDSPEVFFCPYCQSSLATAGNVVSHYYSCSEFKARLLEVGIKKFLEDSESCPYCSKTLEGGSKTIGKHYPRCPNFLNLVRSAVRSDIDKIESARTNQLLPLHGRMVTVRPSLEKTALTERRNALLQIHAAFCFFTGNVSLCHGSILDFIVRQFRDNDRSDDLDLNGTPQSRCSMSNGTCDSPGDDADRLESTEDWEMRVSENSSDT